jgi:hypothetical protein
LLLRFSTVPKRVKEILLAMQRSQVAFAPTPASAPSLASPPAYFAEVIKRHMRLPIPPTSYVPQAVQPDKRVKIELSEGEAYLGKGVILVGALIFPVGFVMLSLLGLELVTGNFALLFLPAFQRRITAPAQKTPSETP